MRQGVEMTLAPDGESDTVTLISSDGKQDTGASPTLCLEIPHMFKGEMEQDDDGMAIDSLQFYARDLCWSAAATGAYACSGGLLALLARWLPHRKLILTHVRSDAASADSVLIFGSDGQKTVAKLVRKDDGLPPHFEYRHVRHYLRRDDAPAPAVYQIRQPVAVYHQQAVTGLSNDDVEARQRLAGCNLVKVPVKPYLVLLVEEVLNPFYVFQVWSVTIWMLDDYVYYAMCVACISVSSALISLVSTRRSLERISDMAYHQVIARVSVCKIWARGGEVPCAIGDVHTHLCIYICIQVYIYIYMNICIYTHIRIKTYIYMYVCIYRSRYMNKYMYIYVYVYIYI